MRQIHEYHPTIGYRFIPSITARVPHESGSYLVKTNGAGFRCAHEVTKEKAAGTFRILLFGDSMTAGDGVSNQYRYGDLIEKRFGHVQVLNFGLPGTGTDQQFLTFMEFAVDLQYDLLIVAPFIENIRRVVSRFRLALSTDKDKEALLAKPYYTLEGAHLVLHHNPVPKGVFHEKDISPDDYRHVDYGGPTPALRKTFKTGLKPFKDLIHTALSYRPVTHYDRPDHPAWLLMKEILKHWIDANGNRPFVICPIPMFPHIAQSASAVSYQRRFSELADTDRVIISDPLPRFWVETKEDRLRCRFPTDPHFTPYGHQVLADALTPTIEKFL